MGSHVSPRISSVPGHYSSWTNRFPDPAEFDSPFRRFARRQLIAVTTAEQRRDSAKDLIVERWRAVSG